MRIMAFGPHPDDIEILCAGTLAKYREGGHDIGIVVMTRGDGGSPTLPRDEIAAVREREARESASILDAEFFWMGHDDAFLCDGPESHRQVIDVLRRFQPDIVLCPDKDHDYLSDHTRTGQLVWDARILTTVPNIETGHPPCEKNPEIWYYDTIAGVNFRPELYVDITGQWETKIRMAKCHRSQDEWLIDQHGNSVTYYAETQSRFRGFQAGCTFAEAFRRVLEYPLATAADGLLPSARASESGGPPPI